MKRETIVNAALIIVLTIVTCLFVGCSGGLRFAPTEPQKQNAEYAVQATAQILEQGTEAGSPVAVLANETAKNTQLYFGPPKETLRPPEEIVADARADATKRPSVWDVADASMEITIAILGLFGGAAGLKTLAFLKIARNKSKALRQIIAAQEQFRDELRTNANSDETVIAAELLASLKSINNKEQTTSTERIVAEYKKEMKEDAV